jgi:small GTP-binding protein
MTGLPVGRVTKMHFLVLGDCGSGKTSLTQHFLRDRALSETVPTLAYDLHMKAIHDVHYGPLEFWLWDASGQAQNFNHQAYMQLYYKNKHAIIVVFDMADRTSFLNVQRLWLPRIRSACQQHSAQWRLCLVANKLDLSHNRQVSTEEAQDMAHENDMEYMELSSLYGQYEQMRQPFLKLAVQLIEDGLVQPVQVSTASLSAPEPSQSGCCGD